MAAKKKSKKKTPQGVSEPPTIHEAELASGPSGAVLKGAEIDLTAAIVQRKAGLDIVVCGNDLEANRRVARTIETAVGPCMRQTPHRKAGPDALPHFQQESRPPDGHSCYETQSLKARKQP
jgi:hypothetical protein